MRNVPRRPVRTQMPYEVQLLPSLDMDEFSVAVKACEGSLTRMMAIKVSSYPLAALMYAINVPSVDISSLSTARAECSADGPYDKVVR
jgi:hypothetical protein